MWGPPIGVHPRQVSGVGDLRVMNWLGHCRMQSHSSGCGEDGVNRFGDEIGCM